MKANRHWWFKQDDDRKLHLEVLESYAETGDTSYLDSLEELSAYKSELNTIGVPVWK